MEFGLWGYALSHYSSGCLFNEPNAQFKIVITEKNLDLLKKAG
ncbi:hypothetical protein MRBBS_1556 [Marinobacter sp. BSs20148]|nr:hypothetical protein MRBBS_1556 [Marinobacter sp. BSs20148]